MIVFGLALVLVVLSGSIIITSGFLFILNVTFDVQLLEIWPYYWLSLNQVLLSNSEKAPKKLNNWALEPFFPFLSVTRKFYHVGKEHEIFLKTTGFRGFLIKQSLGSAYHYPDHNMGSKGQQRAPLFLTSIALYPWTPSKYAVRLVI